MSRSPRRWSTRPSQATRKTVLLGRHSAPRVEVPKQSEIYKPLEDLYTILFDAPFMYALGKQTKKKAETSDLYLKLMRRSGNLLPFLKRIIGYEFQEKHHRPSEILRSNGLVAKVISLHTKRLATTYLRLCCDPIVQALNADMQLDETHVFSLVSELLFRMRMHLHVLPYNMRAIAGYIQLHGLYYLKSLEKSTSLVGGYILLRMVNPYILSSQNRTAATKFCNVLQHAANRVFFTKPEQKKWNAWMTEHLPIVNELLTEIAKEPGVPVGHSMWSGDNSFLSVTGQSLLNEAELKQLFELLSDRRENMFQLLQKQKREKLGADVQNTNSARTVAVSDERVRLFYSKLDELSVSKEAVKTLNKPEELKGVMLKRGLKTQSMKTRMFVQRGDELHYFPKASAGTTVKSKGFIKMSMIDNVYAIMDAPHTLEVVTSDRVWRLSCKNDPDSFQKWIKGFRAWKDYFLAVRKLGSNLKQLPIQGYLRRQGRSLLLGHGNRWKRYWFQQLGSRLTCYEENESGAAVDSFSMSQLLWAEFPMPTDNVNTGEQAVAMLLVPEEYEFTLCVGPEKKGESLNNSFTNIANLTQSQRVALADTPSKKDEMLWILRADDKAELERWRMRIQHYCKRGRPSSTKATQEQVVTESPKELRKRVFKTDLTLLSKIPDHFDALFDVLQEANPSPSIFLGDAPGRDVDMLLTQLLLQGRASVKERKHHLLGAALIKIVEMLSSPLLHIVQVDQLVRIFDKVESGPIRMECVSSVMQTLSVAKFQTLLRLLALVKSINKKHFRKDKKTCQEMYSLWAKLLRMSERCLMDLMSCVDHFADVRQKPVPTGLCSTACNPYFVENFPNVVSALCFAQDDLTECFALFSREYDSYEIVRQIGILKTLTLWIMMIDNLRHPKLYQFVEEFIAASFLGLEQETEFTRRFEVAKRCLRASPSLYAPLENSKCSDAGSLLLELPQLSQQQQQQHQPEKKPRMGARRKSRIVRTSDLVDEFICDRSKPPGVNEFWKQDMAKVASVLLHIDMEVVRGINPNGRDLMPIIKRESFVKEWAMSWIFAYDDIEQRGQAVRLLFGLATELRYLKDYLGAHGILRALQSKRCLKSAIGDSSTKLQVFRMRNAFKPLKYAQEERSRSGFVIPSSLSFGLGVTDDNSNDPSTTEESSITSVVEDSCILSVVEDDSTIAPTRLDLLTQTYDRALRLATYQAGLPHPSPVEDEVLLNYLSRSASHRLVEPGYSPF